MKPDLPLRRELPHPNGLRVVLRHMLPGIVLCAIGAGMLALAQGQPAWLGGHVGPGLMAQILSLGVLGLGLAWAMLSARGSVTPTPSAGCGGDCGSPQRGLRHSAPALLGAVLTFALTLPVIGLVLAAGLAAALAAWGAGERIPRAMTLTVLGLMALVAIVGVALLPPTASLWPAG
jgi:hypothetical protein